MMMMMMMMIMIVRHIEGADIKMSLTHRAVKYVTMNMHVSWYQ